MTSSSYTTYESLFFSLFRTDLMAGPALFGLFVSLGYSESPDTLRPSGGRVVYLASAAGCRAQIRGRPYIRIFGTCGNVSRNNRNLVDSENGTL